MNAGGINSNKGVQELKRKSQTGLTAGALGFKGFNQGRLIEIRQPRFDQGTSKHGQSDPDQKEQRGVGAW